MSAGRASRDAARDAAERVEIAMLARVAPEPETLRRVEEVRSQLVVRAADAARAKGIPLVRAVVAGSAARGTFLRDRLDIDLFLLFPPELSREQLEREGLALARELLEAPETRYAEHPYLRGTFGGFPVDAVPGYAVTDPSRPQSAVDRTPFHHTYLAERQTPETVAEVRLFKQFLRGLGAYGSDARTEGFSGYLVELLIVRYGRMRAVLEEARGWRPPVRLVFTPGSQPRVPEAMPLVIDDPVDPHRNVASALSPRNFALFVVAAREYLAEPSEAFFRPRPASRTSRARALELVRERATHVVIVTLARPAAVDDILYPQLRKAERAIRDEAERLGFEPVGSASAAGERELVIALELASDLRPAVRRQAGPPPGIDRAGDFLRKWLAAPTLQGPYVRPDGRLAVETLRSERRAETLIAEALPRLPLGRDLRVGGDPSAAVAPLTGVREDSALNAALADLLEKHLPWRREPGLP